MEGLFIFQPIGSAKRCRANIHKRPFWGLLQSPGYKGYNLNFSCSPLRPASSKKHGAPMPLPTGSLQYVGLVVRAVGLSVHGSSKSAITYGHQDGPGLPGPLMAEHVIHYGCVSRSQGLAIGVVRASHMVYFERLP